MLTILNSLHLFIPLSFVLVFILINLNNLIFITTSMLILLVVFIFVFDVRIRVRAICFFRLESLDSLFETGATGGQEEAEAVVFGE